jgi:hypothetical protein
MDFSKNIRELLHEHDCIIIPQFGGFVCNYSPAYLHSAKNLFHAPFKKISFNKNVTHNDGLLANQLSQQENISYSEANRLIATTVVQLQHTLEQHRRVEFKAIGVLYYGEENTLLFKQDERINYLPSSFGLPSFFVSPIQRQSLERKIEKQLIDKVVVGSPKELNRPLKNSKRYVGIAASLLLCGSLLLFGTKNYKVHTGFANLNPFAEEGAALYTPPQLAAMPSISTEHPNTLLALANRKADTTRYLTIFINGSIPIVVSLEQDKTQVSKANILKNTAGGNFHLIAGAFSMAENAEKLVVKLKGLGYDAYILDRKLHFVSYGSFPSRKEAMKVMDKIRLGLQQDVWLMTN